MIKNFFLILLWHFRNLFKLGFNKHNCPKINICNSHGKKYWMKNIYLSFYCNIFYLLWQYCVQNYCVWRGPYERHFLRQLGICENGLTIKPYHHNQVYPSYACTDQWNAFKKIFDFKISFYLIFLIVLKLYFSYF